jgi:transposase
MLGPLVRRTLAPKGRTPQLPVRGRHRQKVSVIGALTLSPLGRRFGLYFRTIVNGSFAGATVADFLRQLRRHIRGRVIVVWDRWNGHRGPDVRAVEAANPRLHIELLPAYAPELNPVEHLWSQLKWGRLSNFAPDDADELRTRIGPALRSISKQQNLLIGCWRGAKLRLPQWRC